MLLSGFFLKSYLETNVFDVSFFQLNAEKSPFQRTYAAQVCLCSLAYW